MTFYGLMLCYMNFVVNEMSKTDEGSSGHLDPPLLILGGYSYGSLITSCLPPPELVDMLFQDVRDGSAESEIKQRAEKTGRDLLGYVDMHRNGTLSRGRSSKRTPQSPSSPSHGVAMGGYESEAANRRISRESSRKSLDMEKIRRSVDRTRQRIMTRTKSDHDIHTPPTPIPYLTPKATKPEVAYLIVSPVLPPVSGFTTMFTKPTFERVDRQTGKIFMRDTASKDNKFVASPTCLIYGNKDMFTSSKKVQKWARDLSSRAGPSFSSYEIEGAGHFWTEENVSQRLQESIAKWISTLKQST